MVGNNHNGLTNSTAKAHWRTPASAAKGGGALQNEKRGGEEKKKKREKGGVSTDYSTLLTTFLNTNSERGVLIMF
jgi:hypothetical protein